LLRKLCLELANTVIPQRRFSLQRGPRGQKPKA
jgi:hypothetical protein